MKLHVGQVSSKSQNGSVIVIVQVFAAVFIVVGAALFFLLQSSNQSAALERKDIKSFNVAEAGVDSAIVALRSDWPSEDGQSVAVDPDGFRSYYDEREFPDPSNDRQFIRAVTYDDTPDNPTSVAANRVPYDSNDNDIMWIDSEAIVDNARHRILVQVERLAQPLDLPDIALLADQAGGNSHGLNVIVDPNYTGSIPVNEETGERGAEVRYTGSDSFNSDVNTGVDILKKTESTCSFDSVLPDWKLNLLKQMSLSPLPPPYQLEDGYFTDEDHAAGDLVEFLRDETKAPGNIVYFETTASSIDIKAAGNEPMGTPEKPLVFVVDARNATSPVIDWSGTFPFHGVLIVIGDVLLRSHDPKVNHVIGCVLSDGDVEGVGTPTIAYNGDYIRWLNQEHTLSVAIVPNTWEEYTVAAE